MIIPSQNPTINQPVRSIASMCPDSFGAQGSAWSLDWKEQGCPSSRGKWQRMIAEIKLGAPKKNCSPIHGHYYYKVRFKCRYTYTYHIYIYIIWYIYIYISYIYHKSNRFQNNNLETPETPIGLFLPDLDLSPPAASKAQVNEVQQQTQTKIDVDFDTDPCKCYIKAGMTQIYPVFLSRNFGVKMENACKCWRISNKSS